MPTQAEIEQQQLQEYLARQKRAAADNSGKMLMDFGAGLEDVTPYLTMRHAGTVPLKGMSDPYCMLKNGEEKRAAWRGAAGAQYVWARPTGKYSQRVRQGVHQGYLRPVLISEVDTESKYAILEDMNIDTREGPKKVVSCDGQCLYELSLAKAIEWYGAPVDRYKGDLASMQFGKSKQLRAEGYSTVPSQDLAKFTGAQENNGSNMSVGPAKMENALD